MQKANLSDLAGVRRTRRLRAARGLLASVLSVCAGQAWMSGAAVAAEDAHGASSASMQQVIEAARRKKAQELDAAARRLLGQDAAQTPAASAAPSAPPAPSAPARAVEVPRVWSLTGVGRRLDSELLYEGRIYRVSVPDASALKPDGAALAQIGPWRVQTISPNGVTVSLHGTAAGVGKAHRVHLLPAPSRGSSMAGYAFFNGAGGVMLAGPEPLPASAMSPAALPPSALRASELPLTGQPVGQPMGQPMGPTAMASRTDIR